MKNFVKGLIKINLWFCAGIVLVDTYKKVCDIHNTTTSINNFFNEITNLLKEERAKQK